MSSDMTSAALNDCRPHRRFRRSRRQPNNQSGRRCGLSLLAAGAAVTTGAGLLASPLCSSPTAVEAASTQKEIPASPRRGGGHPNRQRERNLFHEHNHHQQQQQKQKQRQNEPIKKMTEERMSPVGAWAM